MDWFNQWTGFYMITASVMKELINCLTKPLKQIKKNLKEPLFHCQKCVDQKY